MTAKAATGAEIGGLIHPTDGVVLRTCIQILRQIWRQKWLILAIGCISYLMIYIAVVTVQSSRRLPPGRTLGVGPRGYMPHDSDVFFQSPLSTRNGSFSFHKEDLRLQFRALSPIDPNDTYYDNKDQFRCKQSSFPGLGRGVMEDLWCMNRPTYFPELKNPCFRLSGFKRMLASKMVHCVPYFHILGADKSGTTDFHARLLGHPHILRNNGGLGKEVYYWCWLRYGLFMKGTMPDKWYFYWYTSAFRNATEQIVREYTRSKRQLITGDGTPMDLWDFRGWQLDPQNANLDEPEVITPHAMRHMYRDPRFIVLMRNPVDRLYSDYVFLGYGFSAAKFAHDVPIAINMMRECLKTNSTRQCIFSDDMYHKLPMRLHISCYSIFLREWLSVFPRRNFFFLRTEDYHVDVAGSLQSTFRFLELDLLPKESLTTLANQAIKHQTIMKKRAGPMFRKTRKLLEKFYSRFNEDLAKLLEDDRYLWKDQKSRVR